MPNSLPSVSLYIRITDKNDNRRYERVRNINPQLCGAKDVYCLHFYENGKRKWLTVGSDLRAAVYARNQKHSELVAADRQQRETAEPEKAPSTLEQAVSRYVGTAKALKAKKTAHGYSYTLREFQKVCAKPVHKITSADLQAFAIAMKNEGLADRTISNRLGDVVTFLRAHGVKDVSLRWKYVEKKVKSYRPDELEALFAVATLEERLLFQFFLMTGCREQEVTNAAWDNVDFVDGIYTVKATTDWRPKDCEEREIPLPDALVEALKQRMLGTKGELIFPAKNGKPDGHYLRQLKELAGRAGLKPEKFGLHKFRKTYATLQHRAGVDARTIQKRLGHSDLATTLAYLEPEDARSANTRKKMNEVFGVFAKKP